MSYELGNIFLSHKGREYAHVVLDIVRVYFELLMQQYPTKTSAETCHSGLLNVRKIRRTCVADI